MIKKSKFRAFFFIFKRNIFEKLKSTQHSIAVFSGQGNCITPLGVDLLENISAIKQEQTAIQLQHNTKFYHDTFYGAVISNERLENAFATCGLKGEFTRLEKMLCVAAFPIIKRHKDLINGRFGLIISTTKGNIDAIADKNISDYFLFNMGKKIAKTFGITTSPIVISNACVSGVMAVTIAKRMIRMGRFDHCLILGGDLFSSFVLKGFQSFQAVSSQPCMPYDEHRTGISLGEASAALLVSKDATVFDPLPCFQVLGGSNINDANHISGPSRTGEGLYQSILGALKEAKISKDVIDCISSHGTATLYNDEMEGKAFNRAHLQEKPTFSLKGYFGHTLGAAGLLETVITQQFVVENIIPRSLGYDKHGLTVPLHITKKMIAKETNYFLKTASGFGGSNTVVIFKKMSDGL